jgi:hypothetical protein
MKERNGAGDNTFVNNKDFGYIAQSSRDESAKDERLRKYNSWKDTIGDIEAEGDDSNIKSLVNRAAKRGIEEGAFTDINFGRRMAMKELNPSTKQEHPKGKKK